jgi:hypothetical protein
LSGYRHNKTKIRLKAAEISTFSCASTGLILFSPKCLPSTALFQ